MSVVPIPYPYHVHMLGGGKTSDNLDYLVKRLQKNI